MLLFTSYIKAGVDPGFASGGVSQGFLKSQIPQIISIVISYRISHMVTDEHITIVNLQATSNL